MHNHIGNMILSVSLASQKCLQATCNPCAYNPAGQISVRCVTTIIDDSRFTLLWLGSTWHKRQYQWRKLLVSLWKMPKISKILKRPINPPLLPLVVAVPLLPWHTRFLSLKSLQFMPLQGSKHSYVLKQKASRMCYALHKHNFLLPCLPAACQQQVPLSFARMGLVKGTLMRYTPLTSYFWHRQSWKEVSITHRQSLAWEGLRTL